MKRYISKSLAVILSTVSVLFLCILFVCTTGVGISFALPGEYLSQDHFRIGDDTPLDDMSWLNTTDNITPGITRNDNFRVRFQVSNSDAEKSWLPRLEYFTTAGAWSAIPSSSGGAPFYITSTSQFTDGDNISTTDFALGVGTGSAQNGRAYSTAPVTAITLGASSYTEIEFNIRANSNASYYTPYYLRLSDNGTALAGYNCELLLSVWEDDNYNSPHHDYVVTTDKCALCHRTHTGTGKTLRDFWPEESLCTSCHDATGARTDIAAQFTGKTYIHSITATQGIHTTGEGSYNWLPATSRHVECEDCHNPHGSETGSSTPGFDYLSRNIESVWGVEITNPVTEWTALTSGNYARTSPIGTEYQLCMKCHSSFAYSTTPPLSHTGGITETDQAIEFNVNNDSYHWVEYDKTASSGNTPRTNSASRDMTFTPGSGMDKDTPLNCTSCHASETDSEPRGPHGSDNAYLLKDTWSSTTTGTNYALCLDCHDPNTYGPGGSYDADKTNFAGRGRAAGGTTPRPNLHVYHWTRIGVYGCQNCHSAVPHGGWNRALLVQTSDPAPYNSGSRLTIDTWDAGGDWTWWDCANAICH